MKETFFKIFELENHQVLIQKDFDNESDDNSDLILIVFYVNGVKCQQTLGYETAEKRDEIFDKITESQVLVTVNNAIKMFE